MNTPLEGAFPTEEQPRSTMDFIKNTGKIIGIGAFATFAVIGNYQGLSAMAGDILADTEEEEPVEAPTTTTTEPPVAEDPREAAETILARSQVITPLDDLWGEHANTVPLEERMSVQAFAGERFGLSFNAEQFVLDPAPDYYDDLQAATDIPSAIEAANSYANEFGLTFVVPEKDMVVGEYAIEPLQDMDLTPSQVADWLQGQTNAFRMIPKELIEFSGVRNIYLVNSIQNANGLADDSTDSIFIDRGMIMNGTDGHSSSEQNVVPHELAHHIHFKLLDGGHMDNTVMQELITLADLATTPDPVCNTLSRMDRPIEMDEPYEQAASIIARILRNDELAPAGRNGLALSTAYMLDALQRALPDTDISGYYLSTMESGSWRLLGDQEEQLNERWDACLEQGLVG